MNNPLNTARKHLMNFPGRRLGKKLVVFESDDWGSERIPYINDIEYLSSHGINVFKNPFNYLDSLETTEDLSALFETLIKFRDSNGNHPVITANSVVANPDFDKIKNSGFSEYFFKSTLNSYSKKKGSEKIHALIKEGISNQYYHPQFHGREHLNVRQWLSALRSGDEILLKSFNAGISGIDIDSKFTNRTNFTAAFDRNTDLESEEHAKIFEEGMYLFKETFGYSSDSFIAPCYVWHPSFESIIKEFGVKYIQGLPVQYAPVPGGKYRKIYHYQGEQNKLKQFYFVRNCFFEPSINPDFNYIKDCLQRMKIIFFWGKPAIIGTHRLNFIGSLNEENRTKNLSLFSVLIKSILKKWPDVEFITTDKLGEYYTNLI